MAKRSNTQEQLVFSLELLRRIPRKRKITTVELQEQLKAAGFERDIRTVQRQVEMLSNHFAIERDERCKPYGYRWLEEAQNLSLSMLSEQESLLLSLAEKYLRDLLPMNLMKSMEGFFSQAKYNLHTQDNHSYDHQWLEKVRIISTTQPLLTPEINDKVFEQVSRALYQNKWLTLDYKNASGEQKNIKVMPLGLAQQGPRLYLVCRYEHYDNERSLALHRMISAQASTLDFERPADFNLENYDNDGRFGFGEGKQTQLSFKISHKTGVHLLETPLSTDQQVEKLDTHYHITATVVDTEQLTWWLRGFGSDVCDIVKTPV